MTMLAVFLVTFCIGIIDAATPMRGSPMTYWECQDMITLDVSWYYNYFPEPPTAEGCGYNYNGIEFVPMIKNLGDLSSIDELKSNSQVSRVLTFNEPDVNDLSVEDALNAWPQIMQLGSAGIKIGSPGTYMYIVYIYMFILSYT